MKVTVKKLLGEQYVINIMPTNTVLELKNKIKELFNIEVPHQKLLFRGKTLADENLISFYSGIKEGSKLNLLVMTKKEERSGSARLLHQRSSTQVFRSQLSKVLRHYYTDFETETIVNELVKDLKYKVNNLSYDDLERLATALLQDQENIP